MFFSWISNIFPFTFGINFVKIYLPNHPAQNWGDFSKFQIKMKESKGWRQGGQMTKLDLQKHMLSDIWSMTLTFRQVNCPLPETAHWLWPSDIHIWKFKGVCQAQIISNCTDSVQTHGNSWKFPSTLTTVESGRGILFPWFGVLFRSKCDKLSEYFYRSSLGQWSLQLAFTNRDLDRSSWPFLI